MSQPGSVALRVLGQAWVLPLSISREMRLSGLVSFVLGVAKPCPWLRGQDK